jgi:hypothetical protein
MQGLMKLPTGNHRFIEQENGIVLLESDAPGHQYFVLNTHNGNCEPYADRAIASQAMGRLKWAYDTSQDDIGIADFPKDENFRTYTHGRVTYQQIAESNGGVFLMKADASNFLLILPDTRIMIGYHDEDSAREAFHRYEQERGQPIAFRMRY